MRFLLALCILLSTFPIPTPATAARSSRLAALLTPAPQETPTPTPSPTPDTELEAAKRASQLAEEAKKKEVSEKEEAEARAGKLKALVQPLGERNNVTVPSGNVQTDAAGWPESQALANEAARQITLRMVNYLCNSPKSVKNGALSIENLVIYNPGDVVAMEHYESIVQQFELLVQEFVQKNKEAKDALAITDPSATPTPTPTPSNMTNSATGDASPSASGTGDAGLMTGFALPGAATGLIKSIAELVNLFRTETQISNQAVAITEDTIVSYLAGYLSQEQFIINGQPLNCSNRFFIYYPLYMPAKPDSAMETACRSKSKSILKYVQTINEKKLQATLDVGKLEKRIELLTAIGAVFDEKKGLEAAQKAKGQEKAEKEKLLNSGKLTAAQRKKLRGEIDALAVEIEGIKIKIGEIPGKIKKLVENDKLTDADLKRLGNLVGIWKKMLTELKTKTELLITATEQLMTKLNTPDQGTQLTPLARLVRAERLLCITSSPSTYTLRVNIDANGTTKIKKNLFVDAKVRHSARAALVYQLFDSFGRVVKGATMQCYIDYQSARQVRDAVSGTGQPVICLTNGAPFYEERPAAADKKGKNKVQEVAGK